MTELTLFGDDECGKCGGAGRVWDDRLGTMRMCDCRSEHLPPPDVNPVAPAGIEGAGDIIRLNHQQAHVWAVLKDERWHTLPELCSVTGYPAQSISARIRDLRKLKYGNHVIHRESLGKGLFRYRLEINPSVRVIA